LECAFLLIEPLLIADGIFIDAFAFAMGKGLCMRKIQYRYATVIALFSEGLKCIFPQVVGFKVQFYKQIGFPDHLVPSFCWHLLT